MTVPVKMEEDVGTNGTTSNALARKVGPERRARRETLALVNPVATEEYARRVEKISIAPAHLVGLEIPARRSKTFARGCPAMATGSASQRLMVSKSFQGADVILVMPAVYVKTKFARE